MLELLFKNKEAKLSAAKAKLPALNLSTRNTAKATLAASQTQSAAQLYANDSDQSTPNASCSIVTAGAEILAKPLSKGSCLNDIFSDIIGEQPVFAVQTK